MKLLSAILATVAFTTFAHAQTMPWEPTFTQVSSTISVINNPYPTIGTFTFDISVTAGTYDLDLPRGATIFADHTYLDGVMLSFGETATALIGPDWSGSLSRISPANPKDTATDFLVPAGTTARFVDTMTFDVSSSGSVSGHIVTFGWKAINPDLNGTSVASFSNDFPLDTPSMEMVAAVPEPSSMVLVAIGLVMPLVRRRR